MKNPSPKRMQIISTKEKYFITLKFATAELSKSNQLSENEIEIGRESFFYTHRTINKTFQKSASK